MAEPTPETRSLGALQPGDVAVAGSRLILTRWVAGGLVVGLTAAVVRLLRLPLPEGPLYVTGSVILIYNAILTWLARRVDHAPPEIHLRRVRRFVMLQVALDWIAMSVFLHLTGGITSPAIPMFVIHMLMVTILLPGQSSYIYVALGTLALGSIGILEQTGVLSHHAVIPALPPDLHRDPIYILAQVAFFATAAFATVHLATLVMARLRERDRQLEALLQTAQAVSSTLSLSDVWNKLARSAARALSCSKASIRVLDETGERIPMVAACGLSEAYQNKGEVVISKSPLDREALSGKPVIVRHAPADPRIQFPQEVAAEGIGSILVVPIPGRLGPLGVLRVYAEQADRFGPDDIEFVLAVARQGAVAMENAMAHDSLQRADRARAQFVRTVTHELRAPLGGAQSLLRVMLRGMTGDLGPQQRDILSRVSTRLDSLMDLINDLLALAASKTVEFQDVPSRQTLQPVLRKAVDLHTQEANEKQIRLRLHMPPESLEVLAAAEGLAQVFGNLVGNAVKYTPNSGRVDVTLTRQASCALIEVADTGMGIPAGDLPHLWEEFFRATNARHSNIPGTGLGLSIVKRLVETFGGSVRVTSVEGRGTTFAVSLPLLDEA
jgi:signal transduction histidine kinase